MRDVWKTEDTKCLRCGGNFEILTLKEQYLTPQYAYNRDYWLSCKNCNMGYYYERKKPGKNALSIETFKELEPEHYELLKQKNLLDRYLEDWNYGITIQITDLVRRSAHSIGKYKINDDVISTVLLAIMNAEYSKKESKESIKSEFRSHRGDNDGFINHISILILKILFGWTTSPQEDNMTYAFGGLVDIYKRLPNKDDDFVIVVPYPPTLLKVIEDEEYTKFISEINIKL